MYYQSEDSNRTKESLIEEQARLNSEMNELKKARENGSNNRVYPESNYEVSSYNMKNNNKKVMREALPKMILLILVSTLALTILGSFLITTLLPLILGSAIVSSLIAVPYTLFKAATKMRDYDRRNFANPEYRDNPDYMQLSTQISNISNRLREIDRELRIRNEDSKQQQEPIRGYGVQFYSSVAYGQSTRLYRQPQQVRITIEERHR